jgi:uncharacterized protein
MAAIDVFMDTAGFLALWDAADEHHGRALRLQTELVRMGRRFLTTDYVIDETVTLLLMRHSHSAAADFLETVTNSESLQLHWVTPDRFHSATAFFARHDDKAWSFTDCVSFELMHELNLRDSFTTDQHFRQAGFNPLLAKRSR